VSHGAPFPRTAWAVSAGLLAVGVLTGVSGCSLLPADTGPPVIANGPLPTRSGWADTCVVGSWRLVRGSTTVDLGDGTLELTTTGERTFTATADGRLRVDFPGAGLHWTGSNDTHTVEGFVTGVATGTYEAIMGRWYTVVDATGTVTTISLDGVADVPKAGGSEDSAEQSYFCSGDEMVLSNETSRLVYART
jgi:hypothetical protein